MNKLRKIQVFDLPVDPAQGECEGSEEKVDSEEGHKHELPLVLRDHPVQKNVVLCGRVEESTEREEHTNYTKPN